MSKKSRKRAKQAQWPRILVIAGLALLVAAIMLFKGSPKEGEAVDVLPSEQLQRALSQGQPTVVFFHSLTCDPCMQMVDHMEQVYPSFSNRVELVDVNVSDTRNHTLLREQGVRVIPSLVFYDSAGQSSTTYGVMTPGDLQQQLESVATGG